MLYQAINPNGMCALGTHIVVCVLILHVRMSYRAGLALYFISLSLNFEQISQIFKSLEKERSKITLAYISLRNKCPGWFCNMFLFNKLDKFR